ncbi:MAG: indole-3-glycerol phosphate synthase TrpC [Lachnospiraceae bacterium]|nr:indole-3-glycerol phosphate synthase TrpC [Lachnospiraceae bacterium]
MATILTTIAEYAKERTAQAKRSLPLKELKAKASVMNCDTGFPFEKAVRQEDISFICECKKASPSKGLIAEEFPYVSIAKEYEDAGAACISVLTEPKWFLGKDSYLTEIAQAVSIPCIRKDFTVDEYMIYEAKLLGADAVLLICALLPENVLREYIQICDFLGLSALVEAHDEREIHSALSAGARMIGVNNRNLNDFSVDVHNSNRLRALVPDSVLFVAESGIKTADDINVLRQAKVNAVLIGETLMKSPDKKAMLNALKGSGKDPQND